MGLFNGYTADIIEWRGYIAVGVYTTWLLIADIGNRWSDRPLKQPRAARVPYCCLLSYLRKLIYVIVDRADMFLQQEPIFRYPMTLCN